MASFSELISEARRGRTDAVRALYERYSIPAGRVARRRLSAELRRWYDTQDLTQSVFGDLLRDLPRLVDRGETAFRHWLFLKTENKVRDKARKHFGRRRPRREERLDTTVPLPSAAPSPAVQAGRNETTGWARSLVRSLPGELREVVVLRLSEGLTFPEIADRLGLPSANAARKRFGRGLRHLRRRSGSDRA